MSLQTDAGKAEVRQMCRVFGISRAAYYAARREPRPSVTGESLPNQPAAPVRPERYASAAALQEGIRKIIGEHAAWGVRKVWATLRREPYGIRAGHRRVWATMKALGLVLEPDRVRRQRVYLGQVVTEEPNRRWATDLTTIWTRRNGLLAVVPVVDCGCRSMLALGVTRPQDSAAILAPVRKALADHFGEPAKVPDGFELRTDHGPQYTGSDCADLCDEWHIDHTMARVGRPTGNAVAERVIRTLKEECLWLRDWDSLEEVREALLAWQADYNERRPHQALKWQTPAERRRRQLGTPDQAAA